MSDDRMIAALLRERDGYERRGLTDRVALVDEQLAHHGHVPGDEPAPTGRTADSGQQTADSEGPGGKPGRGKSQLNRNAQGATVKE